MNNQDNKINLTAGGYYFPIKILDMQNALDLKNYYHQKLMANQTEVFAKFKLNNYKLSFLSFIVRSPLVRYIYYLLNKKI